MEKQEQINQLLKMVDLINEICLLAQTISSHEISPDFGDYFSNQTLADIERESINILLKLGYTHPNASFSHFLKEECEKQPEVYEKMRELDPSLPNLDGDNL